MNLTKRGTDYMTDQKRFIGIDMSKSSFVLTKLIQKQVGCTVYVLNAGKLHIIFKSLKKTDKEDLING